MNYSAFRLLLMLLLPLLSLLPLQFICLPFLLSVPQLKIP